MRMHQRVPVPVGCRSIVRVVHLVVVERNGDGYL